MLSPAAGAERAFAPALLRHGDVAFVAGERDGEIVATCALHRS